MGWEVIAYGYMEFAEEEDAVKVFELVAGDKGKLVERLSGVGGCEIENPKIFSNEITFDMSGNKGIDYDKLDSIRDYCKENNIKVRIHTSEYTENEDGYWWDSEEDDETN